MPAEKLFLLDLGWLAGDIGWFLPGKAGGAATKSNRNPGRAWVEIPVSGALVEHKDGRILFDVGTEPDANTTRPAQTENFPLVRFTDENRLEKQLALAGYKAEDIDYIVISHLHWDHVGQFSIFKAKKIPLIVQKKELEWALYIIWNGKGGYYNIQDLLPLVGNSWFPLVDKTLELMDGVAVEWTGGHTPGHQILKVKLRSGKTYVLTGDYLHIPEEYDLESKGWLLSDQEEWQVELRKLKLEVLTRHAELIISHDPKLWEKYPRAPKALT
jgi:glyoxylase-like metal-dependent hydrolase (beta-lactamase superfamily II)